MVPDRDNYMVENMLACVASVSIGFSVRSRHFAKRPTSSSRNGTWEDLLERAKNTHDLSFPYQVYQYRVFRDPMLAKLIFVSNSQNML